MRSIFTVLTVGAFALSAAACSAAGGPASSGAANAGGTGGTIDGTHWKLTSYDVSGTSTTVPADVIVDARFAGGTIAGSSGCNVYSGPATVTGSTIQIGELVSTRMACEGPAADVETAYLANLAEAASFTATADTLTMFDANGAAILVYAAGAADPLVGQWNVTGYNNGREAVTTPLPGTSLTATFTADSVSGSGGCNDYNGSYTLDGANVTIGPLASTQKACEQDIMDQEAAFLAALQASATVEQSGAIVTLRDADGAIQVTLGGQ
jgi:heat shock protein HslJ